MSGHLGDNSGAPNPNYVPPGPPPTAPTPSNSSSQIDAAAAAQRKARGAADTIFAGRYAPGSVMGGGNPYSTRVLLGS